MDEDTLDDMYQTMATCGHNLLRTGRTGLVFLPREAEIDKVVKFLIAMGVVADDIFPMFSDLDPQKIKDALTLRTKPRLAHLRDGTGIFKAFSRHFQGLFKAFSRHLKGFRKDFETPFKGL